MKLWAATMLIVGAPSVHLDVPDGSDIVLRVDTGTVLEGLAHAWSHVQPVAAAWPALLATTDTLAQQWRRMHDELREATGADLARSTATLTLVIDVDAVGSPVTAALIRGAVADAPQAPAQPADADTEPDAGAYAMLSHEVAWTFVGDTLVVGNERGVQRQLLHFERMRAKRRLDSPLHRHAARLRKPAPVLLAFALPAPQRETLAQRAGQALAPLIRSAEAGTLRATSSEIELWLVSGDAQQRRAASDALDGLLAIWRGGLSLLFGGAKLALGAIQSGARPPALPAQLDEAQLGTLAAWLAEADVRWKSYRRPGNMLETRVELADQRSALVAALVVAGLGLSARGEPQPTADAPGASAEREQGAKLRRQASGGTD